MPPTNLAVGRAFIEGLMRDSIKITRDRALVADDVLDEETLLLLKPVPDTLLYQGKCIIQDDRFETEPSVEGGQRVVENTYGVLVPKSVSDIRIDDLITVESCETDAYLVGRVLRVVDVTGSTYKVYRRIFAEDPTRAR